MMENEVLIKTPEEAIETIKSNMPTNGYQMLRESLDMAVEALEEVQHYREMDKKLRETFGECDGILETAVNELCRHSDIDIGNPIKARLLIDEDVDKWDAYREIGTVEECREAVEKQRTKKTHIVTNELLGGTSYVCPNCGAEMMLIDRNRIQWGHMQKYCGCCGQAIDENLEEMKDER